jgi:hypothetical protein
MSYNINGKMSSSRERVAPLLGRESKMSEHVIKANILGAYRSCALERVTRGKSGTLYAYVRCIGGVRVQGYADDWRVPIQHIRKADRPLIEQLGAEFDQRITQRACL